MTIGWPVRVGWNEWSRARKALTVVAAGGALMCVLAFVPSPLSLLEVFAPAPTAEVKAPPPIALAPVVPVERYAAIGERPLFNIDRKADPVPPPPEAATPAVVLGELSQLRLVGVVASRRMQLALVRRADAQVVTLRVGDTLDGWKIEKIDAQGVALSGGDRQESLKIPKAENRAPVASLAPSTDD